MAKKKSSSNLKWIILIGGIGLVCIVGLVVMGAIAFFLLAPQPPVPPVIPDNAYDDSTIYVEFPTWSTGDDSVSGNNDFFTMNEAEGRSYALNYYTGWEPQPFMLQQYADCMVDDDCTVTDTFEASGTGTEFFAACWQSTHATLGSIEDCQAAATCSGEMFAISAKQELYVMDFPVQEFMDTLESTVCK